MKIHIQQLIDHANTHDIDACVRIMNYAHQFMTNNYMIATYDDAMRRAHALRKRSYRVRIDKMMTI